MIRFLESPLFGILLTIGVHQAMVLLKQHYRLRRFNPLVTTVAVILALLYGAHIPYAEYARGGDMLQFFLGPLTVSLALPIHRQRHLIRKHAGPLLLGIATGVLFSALSILILSRALELPREALISAMPKSITAPMALGLSSLLGGNPALTAGLVVITGISGAIIAPGLMTLMRIRHPVARGIGIGTAAHAVGTARAYEMGETEGALSSVSIGIAGIITVLLVPMLLRLLPG